MVESRELCWRKDISELVADEEGRSIEIRLKAGRDWEGRGGDSGGAVRVGWIEEVDG